MIEEEPTLSEQEKLARLTYYLNHPEGGVVVDGSQEPVEVSHELYQLAMAQIRSLLNAKAKQ